MCVICGWLASLWLGGGAASRARTDDLLIHNHNVLVSLSSCQFLPVLIH